MKGLEDKLLENAPFMTKVMLCKHSVSKQGEEEEINV